MNPRQWIAAGAVTAGVAVGLGAFGAHGLEERLKEAGTIAIWETGVRSQAWHSLGLILFGLFQERHRGGNGIAWSFLVGMALFSGSLYGLALGGPKGVLGPMTPVGGLALLAGWTLFAVRALRRPEA